MYGLGCECPQLGMVPARYGSLGLAPGDVGTTRDAEWVAWVPNWAVALLTPAEAASLGLPAAYMLALAIMDPVTDKLAFPEQYLRADPAPAFGDLVAFASQAVNYYRQLTGSSGFDPSHPRATTVWSNPDYVANVIASQLGDVLGGVPAGSTLPDPGNFPPQVEPPPPGDEEPTTEVYIVNGFRCEFAAGHGPPTAADCELIGTRVSGGNGGGGNGTPPATSPAMLATLGLLGLLLLAPVKKTRR